MTFSCKADGYWMLCTMFIVVLWIGSLQMTARRVGLTRESAQLTNGGTGYGAESVVPVLRSARPDLQS